MKRRARNRHRDPPPRETVAYGPDHNSETRSRVIGGRLGCQVTVAEMNAAQFGDFVVRLIGGHAVGADVDDTFELVAGS